MFDVSIKLIIVSIDLLTGKKYILSKDKTIFDIPSFILTKDLDSHIDKIMYEHIGFNSDSFKVQLKNLYLNNNELHIYYLTQIPFTSIINGEWVEDLVAYSFDNNLIECVKYV